MPSVALPEAAAALAAAFRDTPLTRAVVRGSAHRRLRCNRLGSELLLEQCGLQGPYSGGGVMAAWEGDELVGVRVAVAPGRWPLPLPPLRRRLVHALQQGVGVAGRWARVAEVLEKRHPLARHAYLAMLGVRPEHQGRGIGRGLLRDWLEDVDFDGSAAWLETDREACLPLYTSMGFERCGELEVHGVVVHLMQRPPTPQTAQVV